MVTDIRADRLGMVGIGPKCSCRLKFVGEVWYEECRAHRGGPDSESSGDFCQVKTKE